MSGDPRAVRDLVARVRRTVTRRRMLDGGESVLVAVSGGPDSLALLHALLRLPRVLRPRVAVAHFDHGIRDGSAQDAAYVARHARRLGLPILLGAAERGPLPRGRSPEEALRERRLAFLERAAKTAGARRIATGHTMDDQAETVLMRMLLGAGRRGLGGIPPVRGPYIRPLIDSRRAETEAACRALRLRPRRDPTNADPGFVRNALRRDLLPRIVEGFNARAVEALARSADFMRDEDTYLDERARNAIQAEPLPPAPGRVPDQPPPGAGAASWRLPLEALASLPPALQRRCIRLLAPLDAEATEQVRDLVAGGRTGTTADLPGGLKARLEYGWLVLGRIPSPTLPPAPPQDLRVPGEVDLPGWGAVVRAWFETAPPAVWPDGRLAGVLDADRVAFPLRLRPPRPGDRFQPLGLRWSKKLSDVFADAKVPRAERARTPLVVAADGRIVWVIGHRIHDEARVTPRTRRCLWLEFRSAGTAGEEERR